MQQEDLGYCKYLSYARMAIAEENYEEALSFMTMLSILVMLEPRSFI
ncbi:MAG: hypothetical protein HOP07_03895 [Bacteriovoracaceae bacterium]|nr:hypothetical protein [Bacteriovoracaceae bacterium]